MIFSAGVTPKMPVIPVPLILSLLSYHLSGIFQTQFYPQWWRSLQTLNGHHTPMMWARPCFSVLILCISGVNVDIDGTVGTGERCEGSLNLVDLVGSERLKWQCQKLMGLMDGRLEHLGTFLLCFFLLFFFITYWMFTVYRNHDNEQRSIPAPQHGENEWQTGRRMTNIFY